VARAHRTRVDVAFLDRARDAVCDAARASRVGVVLGTERWVGEAVRLTALVVAPDGRVLGHQDKVQLDPTEDAGYEPGEGRRTFEIGPLTFGIAICHEGYRYPETVRWAARRGARVVFHPHHHEPEQGAWRPTEYGDSRGSFHEKAVLCRAAENGCWVATINCAIEGAPSTSAIARPDGTLHAWKRYGEEGLLVSDLDLDLATGLLAQRYRDGLD